MSTLEETQVFKDAKALINKTTKFLESDKKVHDQLTNWKSSIRWDVAIHGPPLELHHPFTLMTAFAERIHYDCSEVANSGDEASIDYQHRLDELKKNATELHDAFKAKYGVIEAARNAMKGHKDDSNGEVGNVKTQLGLVDSSIEALVKEAKSRGDSIAGIDSDLKTISTQLEADLKEATNAANALTKERDQLAHEEDLVSSELLGRFLPHSLLYILTSRCTLSKARKGLSGMKKLHRTLMLHRAIQDHRTSIKGTEPKKDSTAKHLADDQENEAQKKKAKAAFAALLADLHLVKNNLTLQHTLLKTAETFFTETADELTESSSRWDKMVGNVGILNNRLDAIDVALRSNHIPTRVVASDLVVRAVNAGCTFLQYDGVEPELRATLANIEAANDWSSGVGDPMKTTLKTNLQNVRGLIDNAVKGIPSHVKEKQWFPVPLELPWGGEDF
ncbi:hypothetical protein GGS20DRAFT_220058 [Poronia punctata]|nr:hypothetical protein GGS20DRAFT_220058 [Poronia punctata]